jgi:hypothetical protein
MNYVIVVFYRKIENCRKDSGMGFNEILEYNESNPNTYIAQPGIIKNFNFFF